MTGSTDDSPVVLQCKSSSTYIIITLSQKSLVCKNRVYLWK